MLAVDFLNVSGANRLSFKKSTSITENFGYLLPNGFWGEIIFYFSHKK
jgi:hypothetical protein